MALYIFGVLNVGTTEEETLRPTTLTGKIVQPPALRQKPQDSLYCRFVEAFNIKFGREETREALHSRAQTTWLDMKERLGAAAEKEALAFIEGVQSWENTLTCTVTPWLTPKPREEAVQSGSSHQPSSSARNDETVVHSRGGRSTLPMSNIAFKSTEDQRIVERFLSAGLSIEPETVLLQPDIVSQELFMSALVKVALKVPALKVWFTSKRYYL